MKIFTNRLILLTFCLAIHTAFAQSVDTSFMFGLWGSSLPRSGMDFSSTLDAFKNELHFNTLFNQCYELSFKQLYEAKGLKIILFNDWSDPRFIPGVDTFNLNVWPRLYGESVYAKWESEGSFLGYHDAAGYRDLMYNGGVEVSDRGVSCRRFTHISQHVDSLIQFGPSKYPQAAGYAQYGWQYPQFMDAQHTPRTQYKAYLRFRVGSKPGGQIHDTLAMFYVSLQDTEGHILPPGSDTRINQQRVYLLNSALPDTGCDFGWSQELAYSYTNPINGDNNDRYVYGASFNVRWSGQRDIYIDQVRVEDAIGNEFWEDSVQAISNLENFVRAYINNSPAIKDIYIMDDQHIIYGRDNMFSARRLDSMLVNHWGIRGHLVPGPHPDYLEHASYSNISHQTYPIRTWHTSSSQPTDSTSIQNAWQNHTNALDGCAQLAKANGLPHYATIQGFEIDCPGHHYFRTPTGRENLCMVNLALAYGVKGVMYWAYGPIDHCKDSLGNDILFPAFVDANGQPADLWYQVADTVGPWIDTIGPKVAKLDWQGACSWLGVVDSSFGIIDSIKSQNFPANKVYVQAGFFKDSMNVDYLYLVNRRTLPSETQTLNVWLAACDLPFYYHTTAIELLVQDVVTGDVEVIRTTCDPYRSVETSLEVTLGPGQGRLFRVWPVGVLYGELATGNFVLNPSLTYLMIGDVIIPQGASWTIPGSNMLIAANSDYCAAGLDTSKVEIIVNGSLSISSDALHMDSVVTNCDSWYGIRVGATGQLQLDGVAIRNAYAGIRDDGTSQDQIRGCVFDRCKIYGIRSTNPNIEIEDCLFNWIDDGYGIYVYDSATIRNNQFGMPEQSSVNGMPQYTAIYAKNSNAIIDSNVFYSNGADEFIDYGIVVDGKKSPTRPLRVKGAYMYNPRYGISIKQYANLILEDSRIEGSLAQGTDNQFGISDGANVTSVKVRSTVVKGFRTGVHSKSGTMDLGNHGGSDDGYNEIYPPCRSSGDSCYYWPSVYQFVTSNSISGTFLAEGSRWVERCSTNTDPDASRIPENLDYTPLGSFTFEGCDLDTLEKTVVASLPEFGSLQNFPNPFNPSTEIRYSIPGSCHVELTILNILGQQVRTIVDAEQQTGQYRVVWDGRDSFGQPVASGVYFYRLKAGEHASTRKMVMLK